MKALQWEKLMSEFYAFIGDQNLVSKPQIQRKWHNWKQYNKGKKKPHPFQIVGDLNAEIGLNHVKSFGFLSYVLTTSLRS